MCSVLLLFSKYFSACLVWIYTQSNNTLHIPYEVFFCQVFKQILNNNALLNSYIKTQDGYLIELINLGQHQSGVHLCQY